MLQEVSDYQKAGISFDDETPQKRPTKIEEQKEEESDWERAPADNEKESVKIENKTEDAGYALKVPELILAAGDEDDYAL